jgi:RNA polymerase-interacting CarD/CdnL/TRCF family regulator
MYAAREEWMAKRSSASAAVARVVAALQRAAAQRSWAGNEKRLYALAREAIA